MSHFKRSQLKYVKKSYQVRNWPEYEAGLHMESGYSKRSKVETTFYRYKKILSPAMRARGLGAQRAEAKTGCKILNTMTELGIPCSEMIT